ncbi:Ankyrin repeat-containing protein isoform 1 [Hibiscus syriacus]|uniref:Ankyrin repeat-containing protein isoform 1 n=1 Tax=Hibiscus syriacus TaxID=106335 RepID=A0A6A2WAL8_HIBSY|nr:Ankyrin repeat-containing protein isoform 1 [Hibiscus syriacus]
MRSFWVTPRGVGHFLWMDMEMMEDGFMIPSKERLVINAGLQKTLGHRTHCVKCNMVQGQFCGDCLYMRYGERVLEANENPNWVCPVCRGICNCSLCRQAKGWAPTGPLYKKIAKLGFKSVAHYLIKTRCVQTNIGNDPDNTDQVSAKRSLFFPVPELPSEVDELVTPKSQTGEDGLTSERKEYNAHPESNTLIFSKNETVFEKEEPTEINLDVHGQHEKDTSHDETTGVNGEVLDGAGENVDENCTATESRQKLTKRLL